MILLKELGFSIEDSYQLDLKNVDIRLIHKFFKNFEELINMQKFLFNMTFKNKKFELNNNFYENFTKKYILNFNLTLKISGIDKHISLNSILDELILKSLPIIEGDRFRINNYLVFFKKYMIYIIFKSEVRNIINLSQTFTYKNFNYVMKQFGKEYSLTISYYNTYELSLRVSKDRIADNEEDNKPVLTKLWTEIDDDEDVLLLNEEERKNSEFMQKYSDILRMFINNVIYDFKQNRYIRDFRLSLGRDLNSAIDRLNTMLSNRDVTYYYSSNLSYYSHIYRYSVIKYGINTKKHDFTFMFNIKNNEFVFEVKQNVNNSINIFERDTIIKEKKFEESTNFEYIFSAIDNLINYN
jgi:hypothetical protein